MRLTKKKENGFYELKEGQEIYGEENGIRLVQIVGKYEDIKEEFEIDNLDDLRDRLTKYKFLANHEMSCIDVNAYNLMLEDLNKYHSIEEELGIDLLNFSKILFALGNETVYVKEMIYKQYDGYGCFEETGKVERHCIVRFSRAINGNRDWFFIIHFGYIPNEYLYRLQDYGKTWALTKEELETKKGTD